MKESEQITVEDVQGDRPCAPPAGPVSLVSRTVCAICGGGCGITVTTENGRVIAVAGDDDHPVSRGHVCVKGRALPELLHAPDRLTRPLRRTPAGRWQPITWDQGFTLLAERLARIKETQGPARVAVHVGQAGVGKEFPHYIERFCNLYGTPNFSTSGSHCCESKWMANLLTYGAMPTADYERSGCILLWGKNPSSSIPSLVKAIKAARSGGAALIVIDPRETPLAREAEVHLQPRPGTDGALALGLLHVVIGEHLYHREFIRKWTIGFDRLSDHVAAYTAEKVEQITGVPAAGIRRAARLYAASPPACISAGVALELQTGGFQSLRAIAILQAVTGNLDVAGGALFIEEPGLSEVRLRGGGELEPAIGQMEYPLFHRSSGHAQANLYARAILEGIPYPLRGLVVVGANPVLSWPNAGRVRQALARLEFLAVLDPFMTETATLAHLVLPSAVFVGRQELWDSSHLSSEPRLGLAPKLCDDKGLPTSWEVWKEVAGRMGLGKSFPWETEEEALDFRLSPLGLTVGVLKEMPAGYVYERWTGKKYEGQGFATQSGKVEIYSEELRRHGYDPLPTHYEPAESPASTPGPAAAYPYVLTTGARTLEHLHSGLRKLPSLRRASGPWAEIHPRTAREAGVEDDEMVVVETQRGRIEVKARYTSQMLPGVIAIPHGWHEANANVLTDDSALDPVTGYPAYRALLARIEKKA
jgi:anaerobic selenocysteine-containing dehydrogenase